MFWDVLKFVAVYAIFIMAFGVLLAGANIVHLDSISEEVQRESSAAKASHQSNKLIAFSRKATLGALREREFFIDNLLVRVHHID